MHKAVLLLRGAHIIEEIQVFEQPQPVKSLKLSIPKVHTAADLWWFSSIQVFRLLEAMETKTWQ